MATFLGAVGRTNSGGPRGEDQPSMVIKVDSHYNSKVYTSGSKITGQVEILSPQDVQFDDFEIIFTGVASTRLDFVQQFTSHSWRPFMKLRMPLEEGQIPSNGIFRARQRYTIPFNFVVPHQLTIGACSHSVVNTEVQQQHLRMPPSVGCWEYDDMAPDMAEVQYAIKARASRDFPGLEEPLKLLVAEHVLKVLPASPEEAPLDVSFRDERYKMAKSKTVRKGIFSPKTGKLLVDTAQPGAIMLSADARAASGSSARVNLQFVPDSADTAPPKINTVSAKLHAATYFSGGAVDHLPNLGSRSAYHPVPSLSYSNNITLINNKQLDNVSWKQEQVSRRHSDAGYFSSADDSTDTDENNNAGSRRSSRNKAKSNKKTPSIRHTATVDVPFNLPTDSKKVFLPSFHNCLISRVYSLYLTLSVGPTNTTMNLVLPLQIGVETAFEPQGNEELPSFETALAQAEEEEIDNTFFQSRLMQIPQVPQQSTLPGYEELGRRTVAVA
ncbi:arrestin [Sarocladium implicatum]|nr:arrestin [Sarocladium implicatum]